MSNCIGPGFKRKKSEKQRKFHLLRREIFRRVVQRNTKLKRTLYFSNNRNSLHMIYFIVDLISSRMIISRDFSVVITIPRIVQLSLI